LALPREVIDVIYDVMYVLDTNILVAALWSRSGASFQLLERAVRGKLPIAVSVALALEYEAVLKRAQMREASWATLAELDNVLDALLAKAVLVMPIRTRLRPTLPDPADDMVLECAVQAGADAIVTMNRRDFAAAMPVYHVDVLKPGEALNRLKKGEPS
jgi:putative PIN family toxin of toxin-antitoxin system